MKSIYKIHQYQNKNSLKNKTYRLVWNVYYLLLFRYTPVPFFNTWRVISLRLFGAKIGEGSRVYPSVKIYMPCHLVMGDYSVLAPGVDCYNVDYINIGSKVAVSQRVFMCTASHDISSLKRPLTHSPINILNHAWVCSEVFLSPGVTIGDMAVVAARSVVVSDVEENVVVGGNPAKFIKNRFEKI